MERVLLRTVTTVLTWLFIVVGPSSGGPLPVLGPAPGIEIGIDARHGDRLQEHTGAAGVDPEHGPTPR